MRMTNFKKFKELYTQGTHIPVWKEILGDMETPVSLLKKFLKTNESCFLLESVEYAQNVGRFSIIGIRPTKTLCAKGTSTTTYDVNGKEVKTENTPILDVIDAYLKEITFVQDPDLEGCVSGFVGNLSFECVGQFEDISFRQKERQHTYDGVFFLSELLVVFDHLSRRLRVVRVVEKTGNVKKDYDAAVASIDDIIHVMHTQVCWGQEVLKKTRAKKTAIQSMIPKKRFIDDVNTIKNYIKQGDAIQVVYSQRFDVGHVDSPFNVYRALRTINPSPYMFYLQFKDVIIVGSSPEVLVKKERNRAVIRPIAGTRMRGENEQEDKKREDELKRSPKENAEHLMLVDLSRNDIGLVCKYGSIKVEKLAYVEKYSHVMHLVSNVEGTLKTNKNSVSLLKATFPAGTVSGAPKIRAMQIIDELEPIQRGPYAGALGYIGFSGDMDMCIAIRTIFIENHKAFVQAGAGIVYDSNPEKEYEETVNKAQAVFAAIDMAKEFIVDE